MTEFLTYQLTNDGIAYIVKEQQVVESKFQVSKCCGSKIIFSPPQLCSCFLDL